MDQELNNPVYYALIKGDASLSYGTEFVKYFEEEVSPFAGFPEDYLNGFADLHKLLPSGRSILYATRGEIKSTEGWKIAKLIRGLQFVFEDQTKIPLYSIEPVPLTANNIEQMVALAKLTRPGPFNNRSIEFGSYYGIFENDQLVSMTGQRLHLSNYSEISAVCTHPDYLGKGYAANLLLHQLSHIRSQGKTPFLHVRADNRRAIALYERLGFIETGVMNFYILQNLII